MQESEFAPAPREALPRHTTPTWEMELLISGATVFALLQLPEVLDAALYRFRPQFDRSLAVVVLLPYLYVMTATYALIATFVLHLATRGYWVALVGMHSVYPDGVRWDALRWGPNYLTTMRQRTPATSVLIERADNRASLVFGYGIGFAALMIAPLAMGVVMGLLAGLLFELFGDRLSWALIWTSVFGALFAPFGLAVLLDRTMGRRLAPEGRTARGLRRIFEGYLRAGFSSFVSFPLLMFVSRIGPYRGTVVMTIAMLAVIGAVMVQLMLREGDVRIDSYRYLPTPVPGSTRLLTPEHYADQRTAFGTLAPQPFIPSEIVSGDFLRLFIPYHPGRDTTALEERCPQLRDPAAAELEPEVRDAAVLDCMAQVYAIRLDQEPVESPDLVFAHDTRSGQRGVVAMLRIATLAPGRHEVEIARTVDESPSDGAAAVQPHRIPFWR